MGTFLAALFFATAAFVSAEASLYDEGERLFRENKPRDAIPLLERAVAVAGVDEKAWLYLALSYEQLGRYEDALSALRKGLPQANLYRHLFYYNMGNAFVLLGRNSFAEEMYTESIAVNGNYAPAWLNLANARMSLRNFRQASADYARYLELDPLSAQRPSIIELRRRLESSFAEENRLLAESEAQRIAAEAARQALIDQVSASLKAAAEETTSLSAGSGQVQGYGDELELDE